MYHHVSITQVNEVFNKMLKISIFYTYFPSFSAFFHLYSLHFNYFAGFLTNFINNPEFLCHSPPSALPSALSHLISLLLFPQFCISLLCTFILLSFPSLSPFCHSPSFLFSYQPLSFISPSNPLLSFHSFFLFPLLIFPSPSVQIPMQQWQEAHLGHWNVQLTQMVMGYQI